MGMRKRISNRIRKARVSWIRKVKRIMEKSKVVLEVLDARNVSGTRSLFVEKYAKENGKVLIFVINKSDLVEQRKLEEEKRALKGLAPTCYVSARNRTGIIRLKRTIGQHAKKLPTKVSIVGYPNVGKSQLANALKGKRSAKVAPVPGLTRSVQWLRVSNDILLLDSPGIIPLMENEKSLALKAAIDADMLKNPLNAATCILDVLRRDNKESILETYSLEPSALELDNEEIIEMIAKKRGKLLKGGELDIETAAKYIIRDWYKGKLSRYPSQNRDEK